MSTKTSNGTNRTLPLLAWEADPKVTEDDSDLAWRLWDAAQRDMDLKTAEGRALALFEASVA